MSCGCPNCLTPKAVFGRSGEIGTATPYADGTDLFQRICFSPPFITSTKEAKECYDTFATQAGCVYNEECPRGSQCKNAVCTPSFEESRNKHGNWGESRDFIGPSDIFSQNPQVIDSFAPGDMRVARYLPESYRTSPAKVQEFITKTCPSGGGGLLLTECAGSGGSRSLVCPHFPGHVKERNCQNSIRSLVKCDMIRGMLTEQQYKSCKEREDCFQYDIALQNGTIHPLGYKVNPKCVQYAAESLNTCAQDCSPLDKSYF